MHRALHFWTTFSPALVSSLAALFVVASVAVSGYRLQRTRRVWALPMKSRLWVLNSMPKPIVWPFLRSVYPVFNSACSCHHTYVVVGVVGFDVALLVSHVIIAVTDFSCAILSGQLYEQAEEAKQGAAVRGALKDVCGCAMQAMGPQAFLKVLPLLTAEDAAKPVVAAGGGTENVGSAGISEHREWVIPLLKTRCEKCDGHNVRNVHSGEADVHIYTQASAAALPSIKFFMDHVLVLARRCETVRCFCVRWWCVACSSGVENNRTSCTRTLHRAADSVICI